MKKFFRSSRKPSPPPKDSKVTNEPQSPKYFDGPSQSKNPFGDPFEAKNPKYFDDSPEPKNPKVTNDPPPAYGVPQDFVDAGIREDELQILKEYDTIIIVDDSGSMASLWSQARKALAKLAAITSKYDTDGIEIRFLNNTGRAGDRQVKSEQDVERLFDQVRPYGATPLGMCLEDVTQSLLRALERGETCKKANYLVITDGIPTDDAEGAIVQIARRLDRAYATLSQAGIQFVQIGTDGGARKFLETLDNDLKEKYGIRDMVDTEPYTTGELSAAKLIKLLLGGINRKVDAERSITARPGPAYASAF